ncbi:MAG: hypothetical protein WCW31_02900 [Patescibacteria group bacterium]
MGKKRDQDIVEVISNNDFTRDLFRALAYAVIARCGTMQHLRRIVNEPELQNKIADLIVPTEKFSATVVYARPTYDELKRRFDYVDSAHRDSDKEFNIVFSKGVSCDNREVVFEYFHMGCTATTHELLAEIDRKGFRPALYEELLAFAEKYPEEQKRYRITALGTWSGLPQAANLILAFAARLSFDANGRCLILGCLGIDWDKNERFLVVRKETTKPTAVQTKVEGETLPANHYRVYVSYAPMPSLVDLEKEFGEKNVSVIFDGREWKLEFSCVGMDRTPGEKVFLVHDFGRAWECEEAITWGLEQRTAVAPKGYRPATHEEGYEFQKAHPELFNFVAPGSFAVAGDDVRYVACLWRGGRRRVLGDEEFYRKGYANNRCLFVSK